MQSPLATRAPGPQGMLPAWAECALMLQWGCICHRVLVGRADPWASCQVLVGGTITELAARLCQVSRVGGTLSGV